MPDWQEVNARKLNKVVSLLLERYHRTHGLSVVGIGRPVGTCHFSFYCLALRDTDGVPRFLPEYSKRYLLTIYQGPVGLPLWVGDEPLLHPQHERRELRSEELVSWFEQRLSLDRLFDDHHEAIAWWRKTYHVDESERLLLTWRVMGRVAGALRLPIETYGRYDSYGDTPAEEAALADAACLRPNESIHRCGSLAFVNNGSVFLPSREKLDLWNQFIAGQTSTQLAALVARRLAALDS